MNIFINKENFLGRIKPVHGISNGPLSSGGSCNTSVEYLEMGIPFVRLHDTDSPYPQQVDIYQIFRDFDKDPYDERNYDFLLTDQFLEAIDGVGAKIIYRLGTSIEHMPTKRWIDPPKDNHKFAVVCEHIIRHYNEGWANGYHFDIPYWEIWNEPEELTNFRSNMWSGTKAEYFALYEVVSKHLKQCFGDSISVGGYAAVGLQGILPDASRHSLEYLEYFHDFLAFIKANNCPLDFFSYHQYGMNMKFVRDAAHYVRKHLDEAGFSKAEIIVDEWNASASTRELYWIHSIRGARHVLSMMMAYQDSPVDIANYYDGQPHMVHCGIFDRVRRKMKPFYSFLLFNKLYRLGTRVEALCDDGGFTEALAAKGEDGKLGLIVVGSMQDPYIEIRGFDKKPTAYLLSEEKNLDQIAVKYENGIASVVVPTGNIIYFEA